MVKMPTCGPEPPLAPDSAYGGSDPILLKNSGVLVVGAGLLSGWDFPFQAGFRLRGCGSSFASFLKLWAVGARWNSSRAPHGPCNRSRPRPRIRLRWAKSISTFFRSLQEIAYWVVWVMARATSREGSWIDRVTLRFGCVGQHRTLSPRASQSVLRAR